MDYKERYINEDILEGIVIPFYKKYFPDVYNENMDIHINLNDNVSKEEQRIYSSKKDFSIRYDTVGKIDNIENIGEQYISIGEQMGMKFDLKCRRKLLDSVIIVHECAHQYSEKNLWKDNESYVSSNKIFNMVRSGKLSNDIADKLIKIPGNYGLFDMGETFAKCCELKFINEMFNEGKITEEEKYNMLCFEKENSIYENGLTFYNLLNQVGDSKFVKLIKNYDIFEHMKYKSDKRESSSKEAYLAFLKDPLEYMENIQIHKDRTDDTQNINELLTVINEPEKDKYSFKNDLGRLVNNDIMPSRAGGDDSSEEKKPKSKETREI